VSEVSSTQQGPYARILGEAYWSLHPAVRRAHEAPLSARGTLAVEHGRQWWTPLLVHVMRLPAAGAGQPVRLEVRSSEARLAWVRQIGSSPLRTVQFAEGPRLVEQSGIGRVTFDLTVREGALLYCQHAFHVAGLRVPRAIAPDMQASVAAAEDGWCVSVEVSWRGSLVCRYTGIISAV
jgi:hypothetical protein